MRTLVMKFGGTSVGSAAHIREVASIVRSREGSRCVVLVSAMAGITNTLFEMAEAARSHDLDRAIRLLGKIEQSQDQGNHRKPSAPNSWYRSVRRVQPTRYG